MLIKTLAMGCIALLSVGCVMGEQVDEHKSEVAAAGAAAGSGGADPVGSGGTAGSGVAGAPDDGVGSASSEASGGSAGADDEGLPVCNDGEKLCDTACVPVTPEVGCGSWGCTPCNPPPANSKPICDGALCEFECLPGFVRNGFACVSEQGGGTGGSGSGAGGSGGAGGSASSTGGTGGGQNLCAAPCDPSDPQAQFLCFAACAASGGMGLCAPGLNCCLCG